MPDENHATRCRACGGDGRRWDAELGTHLPDTACAGCDGKGWLPAELKRTERGFRIYAELQVLGRNLTVQESSLETERKVWLFSEEGAALHLNEAQARTVRDALDAFLEGR